MFCANISRRASAGWAGQHIGPSLSEVVTAKKSKEVGSANFQRRSPELALRTLCFVRETFLHRGILHLSNPNLGPNCGKQILVKLWMPEYWTWIFGSNVFAFFPAKGATRKIHPQEVHLPKVTLRNSTQKSGTSHLCTAIWLMFRAFLQDFHA